MPRDYKNSTSYRRAKPLKKAGLDDWDRVLLVVFIVVLAVAIKYYLISTPHTWFTQTPSITLSADAESHQKMASATAAAVEVAKEVIAAGGLSDEELTVEPMPNSSKEASVMPVTEVQTLELPKKIAETVQSSVPSDIPARQDSPLTEPHFDFYTILPSVEVVIPDHEIKTRIREEKIGEADGNAKYIMQAGSFRDSLDAERLKNKLAGLGVESRVEKAQVGEIVWYRVKVGPYSGMNSVMTVKSHLRDSGVDAIVLEFK